MGKKFKGYDFALCDHKQCKVRETCKRWIAYQNAVEKDKVKYLWVLIPDSIPLDSCSKYIKDEKKQKLFDLLYEWTIEENCDYCKHLKSFRDGDNRHPCNRCECYELFKLDDALKKELDDRVRQIISIMKN